MGKALKEAEGVNKISSLAAAIAFLCPTPEFRQYRRVPVRVHRRGLMPARDQPREDQPRTGERNRLAAPERPAPVRSNHRQPCRGPSMSARASPSTGSQRRGCPRHPAGRGSVAPSEDFAGQFGTTGCSEALLAAHPVHLLLLPSDKTVWLSIGWQHKTAEITKVRLGCWRGNDKALPR